MRKIASIDRFEKDIAVLLFEGVEEPCEVPRTILPIECREGDVVRVEIIVKEDGVKERLKELANLTERLKDKNEP